MQNLGNKLLKDTCALQDIHALTSENPLVKPSVINDVFLPFPVEEKTNKKYILILYQTLIQKIEELRKRVEQGSRLPTFITTINSKSGYKEVDLILSDKDNITFEDSFKSLENLLHRLFLSYSNDSFKVGFLKNKIIYTNQSGSTKNELSTGFDLLFSPIAKNNFTIFRYILWIITGRAQIEIELLLNSIASALKALNADNQKRVKIENYGHILILKKTGEIISNDTFLNEIGIKIVQILYGIESDDKEIVFEPEYFKDLVKDKDILLDNLILNLKKRNFEDTLSTIRNCISYQYLFPKKMIKKFITEAKEISEGQYQLYQYYSKNNKKEILRNGVAKSAFDSFKSLIDALSDSFNIICQNKDLRIFNYSDKAFSSTLASFCDNYENLHLQKQFQSQQEFNAAFKELDDFKKNRAKEFLDLHNPLGDLIKPILQKRYKELPDIIQIITSDDYTILKRTIENIIIELKDFSKKNHSNYLYPDTLIQEKDKIIVISFSKYNHLEFNDFVQCLALQIYGILTGEISANNPSIWMRKVLITNSAIDNFLAAIWGQSVTSIDEIISLIIDLRDNLLEYMIHYKYQKTKSDTKLNKLPLKPKIKPSRDISIISKENTTVLCVDDETIILNLLKNLLENYGCKIFTAENGKTGFEKYEQYRDQIDLVLTDVQMPLMNGLEMCKLIKNENPNLPVILCTGYSGIDTNYSGADKVIQKPYQINQLKEVMLTVLSEKYPHRYAELSL